MANRNGNKRLPMDIYVNAVDDHNGGKEAWDYLLSQGYHPNVIAAKAEVAESKGYIGSGTTIKYVWLIHNPFKRGERMTSAITTMDDFDVHMIDAMGNDFSIAQAARVSIKGANAQENDKGVEGLINYLMREKHGSPFEHNSIKFYVKAPIFVFREFHRHRIASYNEMSGRYTQLLPEFYIPASSRPLVNVGTSAKPEMAPASDEQYWEMVKDVSEAYDFSWAKYVKLLADGNANEVARIVLPVGIMSQMYVTMNLRSWMNFLSLRTQREDAVHISRPQREIEMVAEKIEETLEQLFPIAMRTYNLNGRVAP